MLDSKRFLERITATKTRGITRREGRNLEYLVGETTCTYAISDFTCTTPLCESLLFCIRKKPALNATKSENIFIQRKPESSIGK